VSALTALGFAGLIAAPIVASVIFARETRTGGMAALEEKWQREGVERP
jgi:hypothetical protein